MDDKEEEKHTLNASFTLSRKLQGNSTRILDSKVDKKAVLNNINTHTYIRSTRKAVLSNINTYI